MTASRRPRVPLQVTETTAPVASSAYDYQPLTGSSTEHVELAEECALSIAYNGISQAVMMVTPTDLEDFVVGFSIGNGTVDAIDAIYDVTLSGEGEARQAEVSIANRAFWDLKQQRRQLAGTSGCGLCGVEAVEQALPDLSDVEPAALPPIAWLDNLRQRIADFQPLGRHCGAVHAAVFMSAEGELLLGREDIGRHNALDKLVGALARQRIDHRGGLAIVTSRCSLELIHKALRAGLQTLVSFSAPTGLAVDWARRHQLTLIHLPHHSAPRVYSPAPDTDAEEVEPS